MYNSYNPYGNFNSDIESIIEQEMKNNQDKFEEYKRNKKFLPLDSENKIDFDYIVEQVTFVLDESFKDIFERKTYNNLFMKERYTGIAYILIAISIIYFLTKVFGTL